MLREICNWQEGRDVSKAYAISSVSLLLPCACGSGCDFSATSPVLCLLACLDAYDDAQFQNKHGFLLQNCKLPNKLFLLSVALVMMSYHNNRKLTKIPNSHRGTNVVSADSSLKHHSLSMLSVPLFTIPMI